MDGNFIERYLKQGPSCGTALTNYFIKPNLMCNGGSKISGGSTSGSFRMILVPGTKFTLSGQTLTTQCLCYRPKGLYCKNSHIMLSVMNLVK
jgi:hypothetical protein